MPSPATSLVALPTAETALRGGVQHPGEVPGDALRHLLFADVEKSGAGSNRHGNAFRSALRTLQDIARGTVAHFDGHYANDTGDGFLLDFEAPLAAVHYAQYLQTILTGADWTAAGFPPIRLRIGIHSGPVGIYRGHYDGKTVGQTHRIMEAARGTQILLSGTTYHLVAPDLARSTDLFSKPCGPFLLDPNHFSDPVELFRVSVAGLEASELPPDAPGFRNLPQEEGPFLGRRHELAAVIDYFQNHKRLVTITGMGGIGKSRLAREAALGMHSAFPGGVWLVELGALHTREGILPAICNARGLDLEVAADEKMLTVELDRKRTLLILDGFEQLTDHKGPADVIERLLRTTRNVCCLVTSRIALGSRSEFEYPLEPLSTSSNSPNRRQLRDSMMLFAEAARHVVPQFALTAKTRTPVREICERLEGVPLAILLAADWLRALSLTELLEHLKRERLAILKDHTESSLNRQHASMQKVIEDSVSMLSAESQRLLYRLSIFVGGFYIEDAQPVCGEESSVLAPKLVRLHSLVQKRTQGSTTRYRLLDMVREVLQRQSQNTERENDLQACRQRHAAHYAAFASQIDAQMQECRSEKRTQQRRWEEGTSRLWNELGNVRAATAFCIQNGEEALVVQFADALGRIYFEAGLWNDFETLAQAAEAVVPLDRLEVRARLCSLRGALAKRQGLPQKAQKLWRRRFALCKLSKDIPSCVDSLCDLAQLAREANHFDLAQRRLTKAILQSQQLADKKEQSRLLATILVLQAEIALATSDLPGAVRFAEQAEACLGANADLNSVLDINLMLGRVYREADDYRRAESYLQTMLQVALVASRSFSISRALLELGPLYTKQLDLIRAAQAYLAAERIHADLPSQRRDEAKEALTRFEANFESPEIHALLKEWARLSWQEIVDDLLQRQKAP